MTVAVPSRQEILSALLSASWVILAVLAVILKWALTPARSNHVTGEAVNIGPTAAAYWLARYGNEYGLCQTYANEAWHYQLAVEPGQTCAAPLPNATARDT